MTIARFLCQLKEVIKRYNNPLVLILNILCDLLFDVNNYA